MLIDTWRISPSTSDYTTASDTFSNTSKRKQKANNIMTKAAWWCDVPTTSLIIWQIVCKSANDRNASFLLHLSVTWRYLNTQNIYSSRNCWRIHSVLLFSLPARGGERSIPWWCTNMKTNVSRFGGQTVTFATISVK